MHLARIRLAAATALAGALVVCGLTVTPAARAAITGSQITTPSDPTYLIADQDAATQTFAVSGTTTGGTPATDKVDIVCYYGTSHITVASGVALNADGSFSVPNAGLNAIRNRLCRLRAVPAGTTPADLTPFAGPLVGIGNRNSYKISGGPNDGRVYDYYIWAQQGTAAFDYVSLGSCGLFDGYLFDSTLDRTTVTFWCNAGLFGSGYGTGATRSELQIDGANAYTPWGARSINSAASGLPALSYSYTVDPHTGNLVIHEIDPLVKCTDPTWPPTTTSCATFVTAGVTDTRTITQDHDGHISWITDVFSSTDGTSHTLDFQWDNYQRFHGSTGDASKLAYEFPGQSSYSIHAANDTVSLPASPGTVLIKMNGAADGDTTTGQGAIVYDRPATTAIFHNIGTTSEDFTLQQSGTVPAGGSTRFRFAYAHDFQAANVTSLAQTASTAFLNTLTVSKSGKGKGTVTSLPAGISCGKTCSHGYAYGTSVTLKATAAKGSKLASWSGACTGKAGCTITTNDNTAVNAKFVLRPCVVPNVVGKSLKAAKRAIKKAYCSVGRVKMAASSKVKKGHVISQKPKHGKRLKQHAKVKLVVSKG
jgi:hypothetical protein